MKLFGESQEEDRRWIAELVLARLQQESSQPIVRAGERYYRRASSISSGVGGIGSTSDYGGSESFSGSEIPVGASTTTTTTSTSGLLGDNRRDDSSSSDMTTTNRISASSIDEPTAASGTGQPTTTEDTMKNLRKTFAGIFGDM